MALTETYISVDIETSGPNPSTFSMLSLGACNVYDLSQTFYAEFKPVTEQFVPEALKISGLSLEKLSMSGEEPKIGMKRFNVWVERTSLDSRPIFVAFNATFDWMFVEDYFQRFLGKNPFGISGLDIKAYYMGKFGLQWLATTKGKIDPRFIPTGTPHTHNALDDAIEQARLFKNILEYPHHKL